MQTLTIAWLLEPCTGLNSAARPVLGQARPGLFLFSPFTARPAVHQARPGCVFHIEAQPANLYSKTKVRLQ